MAKMKFPNPKFFRAKDNVDWKAQGRNLQEVGGIIWDMLKETDWKAFAAKQKANVQDNVRRVVREAKTIAAMTPAERQQRRAEQEGGPVRRDDHGPDHGGLPGSAGHPLSADARIPGVRDRPADLRAVY